MAEKGKHEQGKDHVGPAYPARYAKLGRIDFRKPSRRLILSLGLAALVVLVVIALVAS